MWDDDWRAEGRDNFTFGPQRWNLKEGALHALKKAGIEPMLSGPNWPGHRLRLEPNWLRGRICTRESLARRQHHTLNGSWCYLRPEAEGTDFDDQKPYCTQLANLASMQLLQIAFMRCDQVGALEWYTSRTQKPVVPSTLACDGVVVDGILSPVKLEILALYSVRSRPHQSYRLAPASRTSCQSPALSTSVHFDYQQLCAKTCNSTE